MINLDVIKEYLRLDSGDAEDGYLNVLRLLSEEMCKNYTRTDELPDCESVMCAQMLIAGYFYENREGSKEGIPSVVYTLLNPYRKAEF